MADPDISDARVANNNQFSLLSDEQLIFISKCVRHEIRTRSVSRRTREDFVAKLAAAEEPISEQYFKIVGESWDHRIPRALRPETMHYLHHRQCYLGLLLQQNWSALWPETDPTRKYCVYAHVDPSAKFFSMSKKLGGPCKVPFYIGKGTFARAYDLNRNQGHGIKLRQLLCAGFKGDEIVRILTSNLTEAEAFELESKLIYFFGTIYEQGRKGILLNLDTSRRPKFERHMRRLETAKAA